MSVALSSGVDRLPLESTGPLRPSRSCDLDRFAWAASVIEELLPRAPSNAVADVGAGSTPVREAVDAAGGDWHGFDLVPANPSVVQWDLDDPAPTGTAPAGVVLLLEVVEHLRNPWRAMQHVSDLLLPGGFLVLTTPNPRWSRSRMPSLAFGVPACFTERDMVVNHHVFTPWPHVLGKLLDDVDLDLAAYTTIDGHTRWPGAPVDHRYPLRVALAVVNRVLERRDPSAKGMAYGMVARKRT